MKTYSEAITAASEYLGDMAFRNAMSGSSNPWYSSGLSDIAAVIAAIYDVEVTDVAMDLNSDGYTHYLKLKEELK